MLRIVNHGWTLSLTLIASVLVGGCASWSDRATTSKKSPLTPLTEDATAAAIEFEFVPVSLPKLTSVLEETADDAIAAAGTSAIEPSSDQSPQQRLQSMWQWVDETCIDPTLRRLLADNGLRIGRVTQQERFKTRLLEMSPQQDEIGTFLAKTSVATDVKQGSERIQMRVGRRYELPVRNQIKGNDVAMVRLHGETIGETVLDPQYLFAMSLAQGHSSGEMRLRLRPEIHHGAMKQTWVGQNTAIRIDSRRSVWSLEDLEIDLVGNEGDMFVVAALDSMAGIGSSMFTGSLFDGKNQHTVLLVKFAHIPTSIDQL